MNWFKIDPLKVLDQVKNDRYYIVKTDGAGGRDFDLQLLKGYVVQAQLDHTFVRGRPLWAAEITDPASAKNISINFRYEASQREDSVLIDDAIDREDAIKKARAWAKEPITILPDINPEAANQ